MGSHHLALRETLELCRFVDSLVFYGLGLKVGHFDLNIYLTQLTLEQSRCLPATEASL